MSTALTVIAEVTPVAKDALDYVFLEINDYNGNFASDTVISLRAKSYISKNILARIPIEQNVIHRTETDVFRTREYFGPVMIRKLGVRLLDKYGDVVNLNWKNFSFALEVDVTYN